MKAHQLFQTISPELADEVFRTLRESQRDIYKSVLVSLAQDRRLRPVFIQRKSAAQQIAWLIKTCRLKTSDTMAEHVFQVWLLNAHKDLLIEFLEGMDIDHDEDGTVDDLPEELDEKRLAKTVDGMLEKQSGELVALYLHVFQLQQPGGWPNLNALLDSDERLRIREAAAPSPDPAPQIESVPEAAATEEEAPEEVAPAPEPVSSEAEEA